MLKYTDMNMLYKRSEVEFLLIKAYLLQFVESILDEKEIISYAQKVGKVTFLIDTKIFSFARQ